MSHVRGAAGKKTAVKQRVVLTLEMTIPPLIKLAQCSTLAAMEHQLVMMSISMFGAAITKRPFIAHLRGMSDDAESALRQIACKS